MDMKICILLFLAFAVMVECKISGNFAMAGGRKCTFTEVCLKNSHDRLLNIKCNKVKNLAKIACSYKGDPHPCHWYNKNNQEKYYKCLADKLGKDNSSPCNPNSVVCRSHCDEITFKKNDRARNAKYESLVFERMRVFEDEEEDTYFE